MTKGDFVNRTFSDKKLKNIIREIYFIKKLTLKIYSGLINMNINCCSKIRIPMMHRQFFKILSQNPEYV